MSRLQEIFDTVKEHLWKQNRKSSRYSGGCFYRGPDGLKCAAGCLIPDEDYKPSMEGRYIYGLSYFKKKFNDKELKLVQALQDIHDGYDPSQWSVEFENTAVKFN